MELVKTENDRTIPAMTMIPGQRGIVAEDPVGLGGLIGREVLRTDSSAAPVVDVQHGTSCGLRRSNGIYVRLLPPATHADDSVPAMDPSIERGDLVEVISSDTVYVPVGTRYIRMDLTQFPYLREDGWAAGSNYFDGAVLVRRCGPEVHLHNAPKEVKP